MAVNIRSRLEPKLPQYYFGNAIQSIATYASACDVVDNDLTWCAEQLNKSVKEYDIATVRRVAGRGGPKGVAGVGRGHPRKNEKLIYTLGNFIKLKLYIFVYTQKYSKGTHSRVVLTDNNTPFQSSFASSTRSDSNFLF
jgi:hypothetical protein